MKDLYFVKTKSVSVYYPQRCWVNIAVNKLQKAANDKREYRFLCVIRKREYCYRVSAEKLNRTLKLCGATIIWNNTPRYSFYIDYQRGVLYSKIADADNKGILVLSRDSQEYQDSEQAEMVGEEPQYILQTLGIEKMDYSAMSSQEKESHLYSNLSAVLSQYGFECHRVSNDALGADIIAYKAPNKSTKGLTNVLKIQLKSRLSYNQKYCHDDDLYIAFPDRGDWYLIPHTVIANDVNIIPQAWRSSKSWKNGSYHVPQLSRIMKKKLSYFKITNYSSSNSSEHK